MVPMNAELLQRVRRIHAALCSTEETDPEKLRAPVIETDKIKAVFQDFRGGLSDEQLLNHAHAKIHNIANLRNHLRRWAEQNGKDAKKVDESLRQSFELQVITDLSNNDKHGYPPRDGGRSGRCPKLIQVNRVMRLATKPEAGSTIGMTLRADGTPAFFGDGNAKAVITGDVVDKDHDRIGDIYKIASKAVHAWEALLTEFKVDTGTGGT